MIIKNLFENMLQGVLLWNTQIYLFGLSYLFIWSSTVNSSVIEW